MLHFNINLKGQGKSHCPSQASPGQHHSIAPAKAVPTTHEQRHEKENHNKANQSHHHIEHKQVPDVLKCQVALPLWINHHGTHDEASDDENHGVPTVLDHVPNLVHSFPRRKEGPAESANNYSSCHCCKNATDAKQELPDEKHQVGATQSDGDLDNGVRMVGFVGHSTHPEQCQEPHPYAQPYTAHGHPEKAANDGPCVRLRVCRACCAERMLWILWGHCDKSLEEVEENNRSSVIHQRLSTDEHCQLW
mmetsp:Transcript_6366/g.11814  ORF Transcript_6366/g.11814 Transcript_6366/m.11814 type:complete len:249 (+) Transcript_6366:1071-1817(+)